MKDLVLLVQVPAWIVEVWLFLYRGLMLMLVIVTHFVTIIALVLWFGFGVRWGW